LIDQVHAETSSEKDVLIALTSIRSALPGLGELAKTMPKDQGQLPGFLRYLVKYISMVSAKGLTLGPTSDGIKNSRVGNDRSPDNKASLILKYNRSLLALKIRY
jgi:hypothetical protein